MLAYLKGSTAKTNSMSPSPILDTSDTILSSILPYTLHYYRALVPKCPCISPSFDLEHAVHNIAYIRARACSVRICHIPNPYASDQTKKKP